MIKLAKSQTLSADVQHLLNQGDFLVNRLGSTGQSQTGATDMDRSQSITSRFSSSQVTGYDASASVSDPLYAHTSRRILLKAYTGRIEDIDGEFALVSLEGQDGSEFTGRRPLEDFADLGLEVGDYFKCTTYETPDGIEVDVSAFEKNADVSTEYERLRNEFLGHLDEADE